MPINHLLLRTKIKPCGLNGLAFRTDETVARHCREQVLEYIEWVDRISRHLLLLDYMASKQLKRNAMAEVI